MSNLKNPNLAKILCLLTVLSYIYMLADVAITHPIDHVHKDVTVDHVKKRVTVGTYGFCVSGPGPDEKTCTRWFQSQLLSTHPIHN